jgi:hypothetical protein
LVEFYLWFKNGHDNGIGLAIPDVIFIDAIAKIHLQTG